MKAYVMTTGIVFALLTVIHILRIILENPRLGKDPWFILLTLFAASLTVWAWRLLRSTRQP